jgi:hypothetical protein
MGQNTDRSPAKEQQALKSAPTVGVMTIRSHPLLCAARTWTPKQCEPYVDPTLGDFVITIGTNP